MKCCNCGAELESGVAFCRECGEKVEVQRMKKRFCRECGTEFAEGVKYCSNCGANTDVVNGTNDRQVNAFQTNRQAKRIKPTPNSRVTNSNETMKYIVFAIVAVLTVLITMSLLLGKDAGNKFTDTNQQVANRNFDKIIPVVKSDATIEASTEYAYMSDEWNVYTARAISDLVVKVEHWDKTLASTKNMDYNRDIGTFKITDPVNGFSWIDDEHTAFTLTIQDKNNSRVKKALPVIFTINISDSDKFKGTNYDEKIACYLYTNDDWHMYRAIALTDNLIKIECWARTSSLDKFCFGWDVGVIDLANNSTDFKWGDNEHTAFTITMCDSQNKSYWKSAEFVSFTLENANYTYSNVLSFLGKVTAEGVVTQKETKVVEEAKTVEETKTPEETKTVEEIKSQEETKPVEPEKPSVVFPESNTKLGKDFDLKGSNTVYYINVDGIKNKPSKKTWGKAIVTDGVAEYLDYLKDLGYIVTITSSDSRTPYAGFTIYETYFGVSGNDTSWTMYLCIQDEDYVEYELDINLP